jgi:hypothetical protein
VYHYRPKDTHEKETKLYGPDGFLHYYHSLRNAIQPMTISFKGAAWTLVPFESVQTPVLAPKDPVLGVSLSEASAKANALTAAAPVAYADVFAHFVKSGPLVGEYCGLQPKFEWVGKVVASEGLVRFRVEILPVTPVTATRGIGAPGASAQPQYTARILEEWLY